MNQTELKQTLQKIKNGESTKEERLTFMKELNQTLDEYNALLREFLQEANS